MDVVQNILNLSKQNKITNQELCKILNTNPNKIYDWKIGKSKPSAEDIMVLSKHFNVSADYLLGFENKNSDSPAEAEEPEDENTVNINILCKGAGPETIKVSRDDLEIVKDIIKKFQEKRNKEL